MDSHSIQKKVSNLIGYRFDISAVLLYLVFLLGAYFRLAGIGKWPFSFDEYYIARSVSFIVENGLPKFPCGGYYTRGLIYQYVAAPFFYLGFSHEITIRVISALCGLLAILPAYLIAKNESTKLAASFVFIVLSLSAWQIEMSRFGRMYAPFQAVFMWHVYCQYRLIRFNEHFQWRRMAILSILGPLIWEGGIFLCVLNFLPFAFGRFKRVKLVFSVNIIILVFTILFLRTNFRAIGSDMPDVPVVNDSSDAINFFIIRQIMEYASLNPTFLISAAIFLTAFIFLLIYLSRDTSIGFLGKAGLFFVISLCFIKQFFLAFSCFIMLFLSPLVDVKDLKNRQVYLSTCFCLILLIYWSAVILLQTSDEPLQALLLSLTRTILGSTGFLNQIIKPWVGVMPLLSGLLFFTIGMITIYLSFKSSDSFLFLRYLLIVAYICIVAVSVIPTRFSQTRYTFFLYPLLVLLSSMSVVYLSRLIFRNYGVQSAAFVLFGFVFLSSADFKISHLLHIESYQANFRIGYSGKVAAHFYPRYDFSGAANYVNRHSSNADVIVTTVVPAQPYLKQLDFVYLDETDPRFYGQACDNNSRERWTGQALIANLNDLRKIREESNKILWFIVGKKSQKHNLWEKELIAEPGLELVHTTQDNALEVYKLSK